MTKGFYRWRVMKMATALTVVTVAVGLAHGAAQDQQKPFGGRLPEEKPVSKRVAAKSRRVAIRSPKASAKLPTGPMDSIDGKWWTSGE